MKETLTTGEAIEAACGSAEALRPLLTRERASTPVCGNVLEEWLSHVENIAILIHPRVVVDTEKLMAFHAIRVGMVLEPHLTFVSDIICFLCGPLVRGDVTLAKWSPQAAADNWLKSACGKLARDSSLWKSWCIASIEQRLDGALFLYRVYELLQQAMHALDAEPSRQDAKLTLQDVEPSVQDAEPSRQDVGPSRQDAEPSRQDVELSKGAVVELRAEMRVVLEQLTSSALTRDVDPEFLSSLRHWLANFWQTEGSGLANNVFEQMRAESREKLRVLVAGADGALGTPWDMAGLVPLPPADILTKLRAWEVTPEYANELTSYAKASGDQRFMQQLSLTLAWQRLLEVAVLCAEILAAGTSWEYTATDQATR